MSSWPKEARSPKKPFTEADVFEGIAEDYVAWYSTPYGSYAHELEKELVLRFLGVYSGKRIVDVGCGPGLYMETLIRDAWIAGVDSSKAMLRIAKKRGNGLYLLASAEALPFKGEVFDIALSVLSLCFVADHESALREMRRVVRRGGKIVVAVLNKWSIYALEKRIVSMFKPSVYSKARFFDVFEVKKLGAESWSSALFALPWMPAVMLRFFHGVEGFLSRLLKPFGAFLVFELDARGR